MSEIALGGVALIGPGTVNPPVDFAAKQMVGRILRLQHDWDGGRGKKHS